MARLIIVCGLSGSGKTALANELSKKLGIFCLHKDSVKESLYDSLKLSTLEDSKKIGYPSVKVILNLAEENLARDIDVILESPFSFPDDGELFEKWREKYNINIFTIILEVNAEERKARIIKRAYTDRHISHRDKEGPEEFIEMTCDYLHMPEKKIFTATDKPVEKLIGEIIKQFD
jgi:predicted kinase